MTPGALSDVFVFGELSVEARPNGTVDVENGEGGTFTYSPQECRDLAAILLKAAEIAEGTMPS